MLILRFCSWIIKINRNGACPKLKGSPGGPVHSFAHQYLFQKVRCQGQLKRSDYTRRSQGATRQYAWSAINQPWRTAT